jgi:hypothetical protein
MTEDPNVPAPDDLEPESPQAPQQPAIDLEAAYRVVSENEGWDPRLARYEMQEIKRRKEDIDRRERELQERLMPPARPEPTPDFGGDQYARLAYEAKQEASESKRLLQDFLDRENKKEEKQRLVESIGMELDASFNAVARQNGLTKEQMKAGESDFYALLQEMYPDPEMISRLGPDRVVRNTFRALRGNGSAPQPTRSYRDPRATYIIPSGSSGGPIGDDSGPRRSNESQEEYVARLKRILDEGGAKMSTLPERAVINPG